MTIHAFSRFSRRSALVLAAALTFAAAGHAQTASPRVKLATSAGDIVVELDAAKAPKSVENFLQYVKDKHYDGTVFHRVIDGFMIQGGGFTADLKQKPTRAPIPLEASNGLKNDKYTIAMARTGNPDSATSQFFINVKNNVVSGTDVVDKIRAVQTGNKGGMQNVPVEPITIQSATVVAK